MFKFKAIEIKVSLFRNIKQEELRTLNEETWGVFYIISASREALLKNV